MSVNPGVVARLDANGTPIPVSTWTVSTDSPDNLAVAAVQAAAVGRRHYLTAFEVTSHGAALGADVTILVRDGATIVGVVKWATYLGNAAPTGSRTGMTFPFPLEFTAGNAITIDVSAGGAAGAVLRVSMTGFTI